MSGCDQCSIVIIPVAWPARVLLQSTILHTNISNILVSRLIFLDQLRTDFFCIIVDHFNSVKIASLRRHVIYSITGSQVHGHMLLGWEVGAVRTCLLTLGGRETRC